jgi:RNA polymerase sigma-70 factor (ECF subfamily)
MSAALSPRHYPTSPQANSPDKPDAKIGEFEKISVLVVGVRSLDRLEATLRANHGRWNLLSQNVFAFTNTGPYDLREVGGLRQAIFSSVCKEWTKPVSAGNELGRFNRWIALAKGGRADMLGHVLEACRPYLLRIANTYLEKDLKAKVGPSDLVQETFLEAQRHFSHFDGADEAELLAWLRRILINNLVNCDKLYRATEKRRIDREVSLLDSQDEQVLKCVVDPGQSPSAVARETERDQNLQQAINQLPELYRQVILWRGYERHSFEEMARRLDRSAEAVRKLWVRALVRLEQTLEPMDGS